VIAHRLSTIENAECMLYLETKSNVHEVTKGTPEYLKIMEKLKQTNYAH